jgi:hypothetical protein
MSPKDFYFPSWGSFREEMQLKILIHVISQKTFGQVFHSNEHKYVEKKHFVEKAFSFEK